MVTNKRSLKALLVASCLLLVTTSSYADQLPRLVDVGADKCIPCKMMAPILEELKTTYTGRMNVEFIDTWKNPEEAKPYGVRVIPTQIFYDTKGEELFRRSGFISKKDILAKWRELGYVFETQ